MMRPRKADGTMTAVFQPRHRLTGQELVMILVLSEEWVGRVPYKQASLNDRWVAAPAYRELSMGDTNGLIVQHLWNHGVSKLKAWKKYVGDNSWPDPAGEELQKAWTWGRSLLCAYWPEFEEHVDKEMPR